MNASFTDLQHAPAKPKAPFDKFIRLGILLLLLLVLGLGGWAFLAEVQGAVMASGKVIVEGKPKTVQHMEGGIIREITVKNGDFVEEGDMLMRLDATTIDALSVQASQGYYENLAKIARLEAERKDAATISWPKQLQKVSITSDIYGAKVRQEELFRVRKSALSNNVQRYREQIQQNQDAIKGYEAKKIFENDLVQSLQAELSSLRELLRQQIIPRTRVLELERDLTDTQARLADYDSSILQARDKIREIEATLAHDTQDRRSNVLAELRAVKIEYGQYKQQLEVSTDQKTRGIIRAPVAGKIHNFNATTLGGVIAAGQEVMQIVPTNQRLMVEAIVMPNDIDKIFIGQVSNIKFTAFDQRKTPEVTGNIKNISADRFDGESDSAPFYVVEIELSDAEIDRLNGQELLSGMPVETFIQTESRSVLSYLLKPLTDSFNRSMRET